MFTSISRPLCLCAAVILGGCNAALLPFEGTGTDITQVTLRSGLVVQGPNGYCIDRQSVKSTTAESAVALFRCDRLAPSGQAQAIHGHMYTATATPGAIPDLKQFRRYIRTDEGRALLSRSGLAKDIQIQRTRTAANGVLVEYVDSAAPTHLGPLGWRAFLNVGSNIAILSLYQGVGDPIRGADGEQALRDFATAVTRANVRTAELSTK